MMKHLLISLLIVCSALTGAAQGWERIVSGGGQDAGQGITQTPDGGYALTGYYATTRLWVSKTDTDGKVQWSRNYANTNIGAGRQIVYTPDQHLLIAGWVRSSNGQPSDGYLLKTDLFGNVVWSKTLGGSGEDQFSDIALLPNGDAYISGFASQGNLKEDFWLVRIDPSGNLVSDQKFGQTDFDEKANAISLASNGDIILAGESTTGVDKDVLVVRIAADGTFLWSSEYGFDFVPNTFSSDRALDVTVTADGSILLCGVTNASIGGGGLILRVSTNGDLQPLSFATLPKTPLSGLAKTADGNYLFTGLKEISTTFEDLIIFKADADGSKSWERTIGRGGTDAGSNVLATPDGGAIAVGSTSSSLSTFDNLAYLVKTDAQGRIYTNTIEGTIFQDLNNNCLGDLSEPILEDWIAKIESPDITRYVATDANGYFSTLVDTGIHKVSLLPANELWKACTPSYQVVFTEPFDTGTIDIPVQAAIICPRNEVDIKASHLRQCANNEYTIRYCNSGTFPSPNTEVEVTLDPAMSYVSSSIVPILVQGNVIRFNLGYVDNGQCGDFTLTAFLRCDSILVGQAHCATAHIFPDTLCSVGSGWDGSILTARGRCLNNEVQLSLENTGKSAMTSAADFIVIEDVIQLFTVPGSIQLGAGQDSLVFNRTANGKTYRIIAGQSPGYPGGGYPTAAVEGCATDSTTQISLGYYTMFSEDDAQPFLSAHCLESVSFDQSIPSFEKSGHPKGYDIDHYINPEDNLTYVIRFVNDGSDTIKTVTVRDTLSAWLDPATVYPGAASHHYQFDVYANGIVQFTLPNADLLPDGSADDAASSGYVSFRVAQKPTAPCETEILNRAAVFFDFNTPVITNDVRHTVCNLDQIITVSVGQPEIAGAKVSVYPNPFTEWTVFDIHGVEAEEYMLQLYDAQGRLLFMRLYDHPTFRLFRSQIPAGILFYRLAAGGRPVSSGTLIHGE